MLRLASALIVCLALPAFAATPQTLDGWLRNQAAPQLAEVLAKHPKFKGERVRFVGVEDNRPAAIDNELVDGIRRVLTHRVLKAGSNDVVGVASSSCRRLGQRETYLVGIDVRTDGSRYHEVDLAVIDVEDGIWVAGVSLNWRGRLSTTERRALTKTVNTTAAGSPDRPLALDDRKRVVAHLIEQMRCSLPTGLEGTVAFVHPEAPELHLLARELQQQLVLQPGIVISDDTSDWQIGLNLKRESLTPAQLVVSLTPTDNPETIQRLAQVTVSQAAPVVARGAKLGAPSAPSRLLGDIQILERCLDRPSGCARLGFTLNDDAHVLVFRTHAAALTASSCSARQDRREAGEFEYRMQISGGDGMRTGFYVIASRDRDAVRELARLVRQGSSSCGTHSPSRHAELFKAIARLQARIDWRAVHLAKDDSSAGFRRI